MRLVVCVFFCDHVSVHVTDFDTYENKSFVLRFMSGMVPLVICPTAKERGMGLRSTPSYI